MSHVLVVSDSTRVRRRLTRAVTQLGHGAAGARTPSSAIRHPRLDEMDVVLVDLGDLDVSLAVRTCVEHLRVPVVTVSTRGASVHALALDAGADDHLDFPIDDEVLGARLRAVARRRRNGRAPSDVIVTDDFLLDLVGRQAVRGGLEVHLTPREWALVEVLVRNEGRLISQERVLASVWGPAKSDRANYLRVFMHTLRQKLEPDAAHPRYFRTVPGMGLRFTADQVLVR